VIPSFKLICIGASAGGMNAVQELISQLPAGMNAAVFIVLHLPKATNGEVLINRLKNSTKLPLVMAAHNMLIEAEQIYVAPANSHTLVKNGVIIIGHGPPENRFRPSIDVLFRSAAASYRERTIGIILTGFLNDGTSGMWAIQQCGGHCIVQDPNEAEFPDMPLSVLETIEVDHCVPLKAMGETINKIIQNPGKNKISPPEIVIAESKLSEKVSTSIENLERIGERTVYGCPDCGGSLFEIKNGQVKHFRCHIGHSYSNADLSLRQAEKTESTLWVALRMMEERKTLLLKTAKDHSHRGRDRLSLHSEEQARNLEAHISKLKELLFSFDQD
jgi:two-component system chemotaxis response regulator CheB